MWFRNGRTGDTVGGGWAEAGRRGRPRREIVAAANETNGKAEGAGTVVIDNFMECAIE